MPAGAGKGEEANVPAGMPPAAQELLPLFCLGGWISGCGGDRYPEEDSQLPGHRVAEILLMDVRLRQE